MITAVSVATGVQGIGRLTKGTTTPSITWRTGLVDNAVDHLTDQRIVDGHAARPAAARRAGQIEAARPWTTTVWNARAGKIAATMMLGLQRRRRVLGVE